MPIKSEPCDNCGARADYDEFAACHDADTAADSALDGGWTHKGDVFHCPACPSLDDDEDADAGARDAVDAQTPHDSPGSDL